MSVNERINEFDIIKAIAIIMMVWGHIGLPGTHFIYLFHMAVFFIVSGAVYKNKYSDSFSSLIFFIKKKIKTLYVPYALCAILFTLLNNFFLRIGFYDGQIIPYQDKKNMLINCIKGLLFFKSTQMGGATWFLRILFFVSVIFAIINYILKKIKIHNTVIIQISISLIFLSIVWFFKNSIYNLNQSIYFFISEFALGYLTYCLGVCMNHYFLFERIKSLSFEIIILLISISFTILFYQNSIATISIDKGEFYNPFFFIFASLTGFILLFNISKIILYIYPKEKLLTTIGQNTMSIMLFHFFFFKLGNLLFIQSYKLEKSLLASFPTLYNKVNKNHIIIGGGYLFIGIFLPIFISLLFKTIRRQWNKEK